MSGLESDTIGGYNSFLGAQKKVEGEAQITTWKQLNDEEVKTMSSKLQPRVDGWYFQHGT